MSMLDLQYVKVVIGNNEYYYEAEPNGELGERYEGQDFQELLLDAALQEVVSEEYSVQPARVLAIIENIPDLMDRHTMKNFYEFCMRTFDV